MGKARKAQTAGDLWHLSIDDLLMPPGESPEPAGSGPFVINLSTSTATIPAPPARMPRFEGLRLYQVQHAHDDGEYRVQFRLRLGIIQSALEADAILASVREHYPGATLESASDADETAVAEATVTQPVIESAPAGNEASASAVAAESKRSSAAPPPSANTPGTTQARDASAGAQRAAAAKAPASLLPDVPLEPIQEIRWDIDDLLPDLPVTRPSQPKRAASERPEGAANARGRKGHSPAAPPPLSRSAAPPPPARRNPHRAPARKAPAAPLPPSVSSATPTASLLSEAPQSPLLPLEAIVPEISPPVLAPPAPQAIAPAAADPPAPERIEAPRVLEALPPEVSIPAAVELALPSAPEAPEATDAEEDFNFDFDSNADTVEVEALVMIDATGEALGLERDASAVEDAVAEAPLASAAANDADVVFELEYLDPTLLDLPAPSAAPAAPEATIEASSLPAEATEESVAIAADVESAAPVVSALAASDLEEHAEPALSDSAPTQEVFFEIDPPSYADRVASADSVTVEAPALWRDASVAAGSASAEPELSPDSVTVEALALDIRTSASAESPWTLNEADADSDAQAMEALAAKISAQSSAEFAAAAAVEPLFPEPEPTADSSPLDAPELPSQAEPAAPVEAQALAPEAPPSGDGEAASTATNDAAAAPQTDSLSDSQTLEEVVAKLDARSAEATLAAEPVRKEDSQTLEVLVAKIGALVESAEARDHSESALRADAVLAGTEPSSEDPSADLEPAHGIDTPLAIATPTLVESEADDQPATLDALVEPLVHVEPLEVVEWEPVPITDTPAAETLEAEVASAATAASEATVELAQPVTPDAPAAPVAAATPVAPPAPALTTIASSPSSTTAKMRVPAQWPIAPIAKAMPRPSPSAKASPRLLERRATPPAAPPPEPVAEVEPETPAFDSTQTIRALTPLELQNGQASRSFAIQLRLSEEPIHPEQIPNLDIFEAYRLYVVTGFVEERIMHALRLGFFTSEVAAEAVAGYLKGYFDVPSIKRVSLAEHDRFQERRVAARKDVGATGKHAAIELTSRPDLPERRAKVRDITADKPDAPSSIWSRLVSPLKR